MPGDPFALPRAVVRGVGLAALTAATYVVWLVGALATRPFGRSGAWRDAMVQRWSRALLAILGVRVERVGEPPRGGTLLVSNHISYLDIPVIASQCRCVFLAKAEVADWPVIGFITRSVGILFVKREDRRSLMRVAAEIERHLAEGHTVVLFPEGTSSRGAEVLPFRPSLLEPAAAGGFPVAPAAVSYRTPAGSPPASEVVCWWGDMSFAGHFPRLLGLPRVHARVAFGETVRSESDRKALADNLWQAVRAQFEPVA